MIFIEKIVNESAKNKKEKFINSFSFQNFNIKISTDEEEFERILSRLFSPTCFGVRQNLHQYDAELILIKNGKIKLLNTLRKNQIFIRGSKILKYKNFFIFVLDEYSGFIINQISKKAWVFIRKRNTLSKLIISCLILLFKSKNLFALHSALLKNDGDIILFPGASGSGKTTLAISLVKTKKFKYICDEICFLYKENNLVKVLGFSGGFDYIMKRRGDAYKYRKYIGRKNIGYIPTIVIFPKVIANSKRSFIRTISKTDSLLRVINFSPCINIGSKKQINVHIGVLKKLIHQVRCYELVAGEDIRYSSHRTYKLFAEVLKCVK